MHEAQSAATAKALSYENRQIALKGGAATFGVAALTPAAPVAGPTSLVLTGIAVVDTLVTKKKVDVSEIAVTALAAVPGAAAAGEAATGIKEVGEVVKTGQEVLHAGAAALNAGAAVAEAQHAAHNGSVAPQARSQQQNQASPLTRTPYATAAKLLRYAVDGSL